MPASPPDTLRLTVEAPERVASGEPVPMTLRVENVSGRTLDLYLRGREIAFDLVVAAPDGTVVWRRLEGEVIPAILRIESLPPGGTLELSDTWDPRSGAGGPLPEGHYRAWGELLGEGEPLVTPAATLRVGPG